MHVIYREQNTRLVHIPTDWKLPDSGIYEIHLILRNLENIQLKFIAIPYGDKLMLNIFPYIKERKTYSMIVQTLKYVNPYSNNPCLRYMNLKEISHRYKEYNIYNNTIILSMICFLFEKCMKYFKIFRFKI